MKSLLFLTMSLLAYISGLSPTVAKEQKSFTLEGEFIAPVRLPPAVLKVIASQISEFGCSDAAHADESWFTTAQIELNAAEAPGLIVKPGPKGGCLLGANIGPFWIFRLRGGVYRQVLRQEALQVDELNSQTEGFHDLGFTAVVGGKVAKLNFSFSRGSYALVKRSIE
jgi:hypothetical protein